jgi:hypothetical protein
MEMRVNNTLRWVLIVVIALAILALVVFAHGQRHHRGDEVGASGAHFAATPTGYSHV